MIRAILVLFVSSIFLFATGDSPMVIDSANLIGSVAMIGLTFWAFYRAMKTRNPKYGYLIVLAIVLMFVLLFI